MTKIHDNIIRIRRLDRELKNYDTKRCIEEDGYFECVSTDENDKLLKKVKCIIRMAPYDTIVVGLGAAGCQAASTLAQSGKHVLGLEAQGRVGGRVNTVPFGEGLIELGAEWIHGTVGNRVYDTVMASNLQLVNEYMTYKTFRSDGSVTEQELALEVVNQLLESDEVPAEAGSLGETLVMNVQQYFAKKYPDILKDDEYMTEFYQLLELLINNLNASNSWNDITSQSSQSFLEGCWHVSWHKLGYKTLFDILLNKHNGGPGYPNLEVKLNTEVVHVQWPQDPRERVKVTTKDGTVYTADNVIITLSVEDKRKVGREDFWTTKILGVSCPKGSRNTVTFWTSGEIAKIVETLPEQVVSTKLMALLRKFLGLYIKNIPEPTRMIRSTWHTNPYTRGSYTYDNVQTPQHPTARSDLGSPLLDAAGNPRVLFAGEATEANNYATVHGAADSGYREAKRVLDCGYKKTVVQSKY
ncbi:hypothetical protein K1T71_000649 [Dendrolimus kikuchii]|uniref:Uncharacterized protein n=1 Tax=Dendrolimus kikuchii TaxID=765133 RepID=A0ACC1DJZ8_9NEOP|nr:hypothetical protein K1T71_000649 [Dendrolimus kikuchii]